MSNTENMAQQGRRAAQQLIDAYGADLYGEIVDFISCNSVDQTATFISQMTGSLLLSEARLFRDFMANENRPNREEWLAGFSELRTDSNS